jgi:two-component sensor histidine kinase
VSYAEVFKMLDLISVPAIDLIESDQAEELRERHNDWEFVLTEAHHRMKNTLALLAASLRRDFTPAASADLRNAIDRFEGRILAFGELYRLLEVGRGQGETSVGDYFGCLCRALTIAVLEPLGLRCETTIEDGSMATKQCEPLGLIIVELVTNAAKHAFPSGNDGLVSIDLLYREGRCCTVSDNGIGVAGPLRGSGARILEDLRARTITAFGCRGTTVTVVLPN